jgi:hypothetical protein
VAGFGCPPRLLELNPATGSPRAPGSTAETGAWTGLELADAVAGLVGTLVQRPGLWVGADGQPNSRERPWTAR